MVDAVEALVHVGGVATRAHLLGLASRAAVDRAVAAGDILVPARDRYVLPAVDESIAVAHAVTGVLSHASAALFHGWAVQVVPDRPHVTVRRKRRLSADQQRQVHPHFADLHGDDITGPATSKMMTLQHCLRALPFSEALAIADSALRVGDEQALTHASRLVRGPGSARVRRIVSLARRGAANPFESALRAIALDVPGLHVVPQVTITEVEPWVRPDLVDEDLRVVLEADSFEWHGDRAALRRDARRYDELVAAGWIVLRFAWEDVMSDPEFVRRMLVDVVTRVHEQAQPHCHCCSAA